MGRPRKAAPDAIDPVPLEAVTDWVAETVTTPAERLRVFNRLRAGQTVYGASGVPIIFDSDGYAEPNAEDIDLLVSVPGYERA